MKLWEKNLRDIEPYVPGEQSKEKNIVKLNANENPYPPSPKAVEAIHNFNCERLRFYPDAKATEFRSAIAEFYGVDIKNVFIGNGSDDVLGFAFQGFYNSDKPIVYPDITYSFYPVWCRLYNIPYKNYPLDENFRINVEDYKEPNGGVVLPNPNAPTSLGFGHDFVRKLMEYNQDCIVIIDEAYVDFGGTSSVPLTAEYENLLVVGTFSKSRSLAGMRIGYAIGSEKLIETLEAIKNCYNSYPVGAVSLAAGTASIKDKEYFNATISKIIATRTRVTNELRALGFTVFDSETNFIFATKEGMNTKDYFEWLKAQKVFIRYFNMPRIDNYVRITIGTDSEMDIFLQKTKEYLAK